MHKNRCFRFLTVQIFLIYLWAVPVAFAACQSPPSPEGAFDCGSFSYAGTQCVSQAYIDSISGTESGGNYQCVNSIAANGRYQFMDGTRADLCSRTNLPCVGAGDFAYCPALQDAYFQEFNKDNYQKLQNCGALNKKGQSVNGVVVTESGLLAAAHLGGAGGACNWANSGGTYDPNDGATSLTDYARKHGGIDAMGSDCPAVAPSAMSPSQPPLGSCATKSPLCAGAPDFKIGSTLPETPGSLDPNEDLLDMFTPDWTTFLRCMDHCDNTPTSSTTKQAYYYYCSQPNGTNYTQFTGCCSFTLGVNNNPCADLGGGGDSGGD